MSEKKEFIDKAVLITGSSRGIGKAVASAFSKEGARVAVHFKENRAAAEETLSSLAGSGHILLQADLCDPESARTLIEGCVEGLGGLHILVNNAGIYRIHALEEVSFREWRSVWEETLRTNLFGPANVTYWAAKYMMEKGGGRIVNVSSRGAFRGEPRAPAYGASKAGMNAMGQSLAKALAPHKVFVMTVAPGYVETDMARRHLTGPEGEAIRKQSPLGRVAKAEEVAHTVLFLASPKAEFLTGCIVDINGASYLRT